MSDVATQNAHRDQLARELRELSSILKTTGDNRFALTCKRSAELLDPTLNAYLANEGAGGEVTATDGLGKPFPSPSPIHERPVAGQELAHTIKDLELYEAVHFALDAGKTWEEIDLGWREDAQRPTYDYWLAYMQQRLINGLKSVRWAQALASQPPATRSPRDEALEEAAKVAEAYPENAPFGEHYTAYGLMGTAQNNAARDIGEAIRALKTKTPAPAPEGWKPIAEAPKDGTRILIGRENTEPAVGFFVEGQGWFDYCEVQLWRVFPPTHWQPLPAQPKEPTS